jgi:hypothetical protein
LSPVQPGTLQCHRVVGIEVIDPENALAALKECGRSVEADEAGNAGNEVGQGALGIGGGADDAWDRVAI